MAYTTINKSSEHFNTITYTGDAQANTNRSAGFQPDWIWIKQRNGTGNHRLLDSVRGANKLLYSTGTNAEDTSSMISAITSTGYTTSNTDSGNVNGNGESYVNWFWKAGGTSSSNTDGSTTSTVSVNTTSGFSIVKYTGTSAVATIGHGLGVVPSIIIVKNLSSGTRKWAVWHKNLSANNKYLSLNETSAELTDSAVWNNTAPTSSVFSSAANGEVNQGGENFIAYCFAEKIGYSKFGSYTGNGNADGTFVYTGFKPAYVTLKRSSNTSDWHHFDNKRAGFNGDNDYLKLNAADDEGTSGDRIDFLSNGFKLRYATGNLNETGDTFIYNAFAEAPLVGTNGVTAKAR
jgi:hypothetical protein